MWRARQRADSTSSPHALRGCLTGCRVPRKNTEHPNLCGGAGGRERSPLLRRSSTGRGRDRAAEEENARSAQRECFPIEMVGGVIPASRRGHWLSRITFRTDLAVGNRRAQQRTPNC
jgi:hypothetical protein